MFSRRTHLPLALLALSTGCGAALLGGPSPQRSAHEHELRCARAVMGRDSPYRMPLADPVHDLERLALLAELPHEARRTARAAGLEPLLAELLRLRALSPSSDAALAPKQELALRMTAFHAQAQSLAFEVGCTRERVGELLASLDAEESARQLRLATASLILGAASGTVAGVWDQTGTSSPAPAWIAIVGGVLTAGVGAAALLVPERAVLLEHRQNLLRPIFEGTDPEHLYPSFVFRSLTARFEEREPVPRDGLAVELSRILEGYVPPENHARSVTILSGPGGLYPRPLLEARKALLHAVELAVAGVARDLELFDRTVVRLFASPPAPPPRSWP